MCRFKEDTISEGFKLSMSSLEVMGASTGGALGGGGGGGTSSVGGGVSPSESVGTEAENQRVD